MIAVLRRARPAGRVAVLAAALLVGGAVGCDPAPLAGKGCPCASGYVCCEAEAVCLPAGEICAAAFAWPPPDLTVGATPLPLGDSVVFAMSQMPDEGRDPQVLDLRPDLVVRGWSTWDRDGLTPDQYDTAYLDECHQANIRFIGGANLAALFRDQVDSDAELYDLATRDAAGDPVRHDDVAPDLYWASLANPKVRQRAIAVGKMQIDLGVDGLQFVGLDSDLNGDMYQGDEGFDDYHLADFNAFLLAKYPDETDFAGRFSMPPHNVLRRDLPAGDPRNFNYRTYLRDMGLGGSPLAISPLHDEWGVPTSGRASEAPRAFVEVAGAYTYWRQIAATLHAYAQTRGRDVFINVTGVYPFADFQAVGLWGNASDRSDGQWTSYVPTRPDGRLDGAATLQPAFTGIRARAAALTPGAPVVVFLDGDWDRYGALGAGELQDYWRLYGAEAYANGLFFAFNLYSPGDPQRHTAEQLGLMPLFKSQAAFYRAHRDLYVGSVPSRGAADPVADAMVALADQPDPADPSHLRRRLVHVVNHAYQGGIVARSAVPLLVSSSVAPAAVTLASPDLAADVPLASTYADGQISLVLPSLVAYDVVVISY